ncbi:unnamed protein product, partial [Prorocentrum cordatum]
RQDETSEEEDSDAAQLAARLSKEVQSWGPHPSVERFQMAPRVAWERELMMCGCQCHNTLDWKGRNPVPTTARSVWLLPAQDDAAEHVAEDQASSALATQQAKSFIANLRHPPTTGFPFVEAREELRHWLHEVIEEHEIQLR